LSGSYDSAPLQLQGMKTAMSLQPLLASKAAAEAMGKPALSSDKIPSLNPVKTELPAIGGVQAHSDVEIKKVLQNFESIFLRMIFKQMRESVEKSDLLGHSKAMEFFEQMQDEQVSDQ